jgi:hypothetical protein
MLVRALKTFNGRYGKINKGQTFNAEPNYVRDLNKRKSNPMVEVLEKDDRSQPGPSQDRNKGDAPQRAGNDQRRAPGAAPADTAGPSVGGAGITSASLPAVPASRRATSKPLPVGGRRVGKATPRKAKAKTASTPRADA